MMSHENILGILSMIQGQTICYITLPLMHISLIEYIQESTSPSIAGLGPSSRLCHLSRTLDLGLVPKKASSNFLKVMMKLSRKMHFSLQNKYYLVLLIFMKKFMFVIVILNQKMVHTTNHHTGLL